MQKDELIKALKELEEERHYRDGYNVKDILRVLRLKVSRENEKLIRGGLRALISKRLYPEFATAGEKDIVYCPKGKESGLYRLSAYRE